MSMWHDALEVGLLPLEETGLYCDGITYVISHLLRKSGIPHRCNIGYVKDKKCGDLVAPHCWGEQEDNDDWIVDLPGQELRSDQDAPSVLPGSYYTYLGRTKNKHSSSTV